ncbi:fumarate hydratase C-terminal domain-containing protein, partial [[Eubacterium] cellulosolvens]
MIEEIILHTPLKSQDIGKLICGDRLKLTGTIYTARDAAHKRLIQLLEDGKPLPFDIKDQVIYYVGPTPEKPGEVI